MHSDNDGWKTDNCCPKNYHIKTKKCQPAASDTPDIIQTECVTDSSLAHPNKKIKKRNIQTNYTPKKLAGKWTTAAR